MSSEELREAICEGDYEKSKTLIENGANVNYIDYDDGWSLCLWAVKSNQPACLELLLQNGAHVHIGDSSGNTPLHKAAYLGYKSCLDILLKYKASPSMVNKRQQTPLDLAELFERTEIVTQLKEITSKEENQQNEQNKEERPKLHEIEPSTEGEQVAS